MKTQKDILKWLQANLGKHSVAALTSGDTYALVTSVNLSNLISHNSAPPGLFDAYRAIVSQMQDHTRQLAFHAIACELDWSHRAMIWHNAGMGDQIPPTKCEGEPR